MAPDRLAHETDSAVEKLLLKRNGEHKTVNDVFEIVVAMNHDRRADAVRMLGEIQQNRLVLERHLTDDVRMSNEEFTKFIARFDKRHDDRDAIVAELNKDVRDIKENCTKLHLRAPRRSTDPDGIDYRTVHGDEDEELGDIRRFWRTGKWIVMGVAAPFVVAFGDHLSHLIWPD